MSFIRPGLRFIAQILCISSLLLTGTASASFSEIEKSFDRYLQQFDTQQGQIQSRARQGICDGLPGSIAYKQGYCFVPVSPIGDDVRTILQSGGANVAEIALVRASVTASSPDGEIFAATQDGQIYRIDHDRDTQGVPFFMGLTLVLDVRHLVSRAIDRGVVGFTVHPDFKDGTGRFYLNYTHKNGAQHEGYYVDTSIPGCGNPNAQPLPDNCTKVAKKTSGVSYFNITNYIGDSYAHQILGKRIGTPAKPSCDDYAKDDDCINADAGSHGAGGLAFHPISKALLVTTGDGAGFYEVERVTLRAEDLDSLSGKVLAIDPDTGKGLPSNPYWTGNGDDNRSKVIAAGYRNPFRLLILQNGDVIVFNVGWNQAETAYLIEWNASRFTFMSAGWACRGFESTITYYQFADFCKGFDPGFDVSDPLYSYRHLPDDYLAAIVGGARLLHSSYPVADHGKIVIGDYRKDWVKLLSYDDQNRIVTGEEFLAQGTDPNHPVELGAPVQFYNTLDGRVYAVMFVVDRVDGFNISGIYELVYYGDAEVGVQLPMSTASLNYELTPEGHMFDCSESYIHIPGEAQCFVDFGDGTTASFALGESVLHQYAYYSTFDVTLTLYSGVGEVLDTSTESVQVSNPTNQVQPYVVQTHLPQWKVTVSETFDVDLVIGNMGEDHPFCVQIDARDSNGVLVKNLQTQKCFAGLQQGLTDDVNFTISISEEGNHSLSLTSFAASADADGLWAVSALVGIESLGDIYIHERSVIDGESVVNSGNDVNCPNTANDWNSQGPIGGWDNFSNYPGGREGGCIVVFSG